MTGLSDLMSIRFWMTPNPGAMSDQTVAIFSIVFGACILLKILFRYMGRQYAVSLSRYHQTCMFRFEKLFLTMGLLGFLWLFFAYEMIPFFSGRYWFAIWILGVVIWAYYIFYYIRYEIPAFIERDKERAAARKYMPHKGSR
jgi:hypothetical protein